LLALIKSQVNDLGGTNAVSLIPYASAISSYIPLNINHVVNPERAELIILNMLGHIVEGYEKEFSEPFPKENTIAALINFVSLKSQDKAISNIVASYGMIEESKHLDKKAEKKKLFANFAQFLLDFGFPNGKDDLGFGSLNGSVWAIITRVLPGVLQTRMTPYISGIVTTQKKGKELEAKIRDQHGPEVIIFAQAVNDKVKVFVASMLVGLNQPKKGSPSKQNIPEWEQKFYDAVPQLDEDSAEVDERKKLLAAAQKKIFAAAPTLGSAQSVHFLELKDKMLSHLYPIMLRVFDVLLRDNPPIGQPGHVDALAYIISRLIDIPMQEAAWRPIFTEHLKEMTPEEIELALHLAFPSQIPLPDSYKQAVVEYKEAIPTPQAEVEKTKAQKLAHLLQYLANTHVANLGIPDEIVNEIVPIWGEKISGILKLLIAQALLDYHTGANIEVKFQREMEDYASAERILQAFFTGKITPTIDGLFKTFEEEQKELVAAGEIGENENLTPNPEKEAARLGRVWAKQLNEGVGKSHQIHQDYLLTVFNTLIKLERYQFFRELLGQFGAHRLTACLGALAASYPGNPPGNAPIRLWPAALKHLVLILKKEIKNPALLEQKLLNWKEMPATTEEQRKAKELAKEELLELFKPAAARLIRAMRMKEVGFLPLPKIVKDSLVESLEQTILPDLLFDFAQGLAFKSFLSAEDYIRLLDYSGVSELEQMGLDISSKVISLLKPALRENASIIAHSINEAVASNRLTPTQEVEFGEGIQEVMSEIPDALLETVLNKLLPDILKKLATSYRGKSTKDATTAALLQLRVRFAEANIDKKMYTNIKKYMYNNREIIATEAQLGLLRNKLLNPGPEDNVDQLRSQIAELLIKLNGAPNTDHFGLLGRPRERLARVREYKLLLSAFKPLAVALLADIGIRSGRDLPLGTVAQDATYEAIVNGVIPDQLLHLYVDHLHFGVEGKRHEAELDARFGKGLLLQGEHSGVVLALKSIAGMIVLAADNYLIAHSEEIAAKARAALRPAGQVQIPSQTFVPGQFATAEIREKEGEVLAERILGKGVPLKSEFLFPALRKELQYALFDVVNHFFKNLEGVENQTPLGEFILNAINILTTHLTALTNAAEGGYIYDAKPSRIAKELEVLKAAHRDYPSVQTLTLIEQNNSRIANLFREAGTPHDEALTARIAAVQGEHRKARLHTIQNEIKALRKANNEIKNELRRDVEKGVYSRLAKWILRMAGKRKAEDLAVSSQYQKMIWDLLNQDELFAAGLHEALEALGSRETVDKLLAMIAQKLNAAIEDMSKPAAPAPKQAPAAAEAANQYSSGYPGASKSIDNLLGALGKTLPGTWTEWFMRKPYVRNLLVPQIEAALRNILTDWSIQTLVEKALVAPDPNAPPLVMPVRPEEWARARQIADEENQQALGLFKREAERMPEELRKLANQKLSGGKGVSKMALGVVKYTASKFLDRFKVSVQATTDPLHRSIVGVEAHQNLLLQLLEALMEAFPGK